MDKTTIAYRVTGRNEPDEWCADASSADAAVARRLGVSTDGVGALARPVTVDPVVLRREDGRWRSRKIWNFRAGDAAARVYEMLHIDEAEYDH